MRIAPQDVGPIHFIGIGGIGMSGIADILHDLGYQVQGSDLHPNASVERLKDKGIIIHIGHHAENLGTATVTVISSAVRSFNPELIEARRRGLPVVKRAEMLAEIMRLKPSIAIAGTHGKTTTTSLTATVLEAGLLDPTVISGGIINSYGTNAKLGVGEWLVAEADESDGTFTKLPATIAVVTNIEAEHMDYYKSFQQLKDAFHSFIENIPFYGLAVVCRDDLEIKNMLPNLTDRRVVTYGFEEGCDLQAYNVRADDDGMTFDLKLSSHFHRLCPHADDQTHATDIRLPILGEHNVLNALSSIACALEVKMTWSQIKQGLINFKGVGRRFSRVGQVNGITIIDDYAHHPTEVTAVLKTIRMVSRGNVIAVVQPHRYSRLNHLFADFITCFMNADQIIFTPLYGAGEQPIDNINHETLAHAVSLQNKPVHVIFNQSQLAPLLATIVQPGDYVICMGAGSITQWAAALPNELRTLWQNHLSAAV